MTQTHKMIQCRICYNTYNALRGHCDTCGAINLGKYSYKIREHEVISFVRAHGAVSVKGSGTGVLLRYASCDPDQ